MAGSCGDGGDDAGMRGPRHAEALPPSTRGLQVTLGIGVQVGQEGGNARKKNDRNVTC